MDSLSEPLLLQYSSEKFTDVDELASVLAAWDQTYDQIDRGPFLSKISQLRIGPAVLHCEKINTTVYNRYSVPKDSIVFGFEMAPCAKIRWGAEDGLDNAMVIHPPGTDAECVWKGGVIACLTVELDPLLNYLSDVGSQAAETINTLKCPVKVDLDNSGLGQLRDLFCQLFKARIGALLPLSEEAAAADLLRLIFSTAADLLDDMSPPKASGRLERMRRTAANAEEYLRGNISRSLSINELCRVANVSERTLRNIFMRSRGLAPYTYHQLLRLNEVRRRLKTADPKSTTVSSIAAAVGFWHMGDFAKLYRGIFAETPSQTLQRPLRTRQPLRPRRLVVKS